MAAFARRKRAAQRAQACTPELDREAAATGEQARDAA
jgi:hypothetical protein